MKKKQTTLLLLLALIALAGGALVLLEWHAAREEEAASAAAEGTIPLSSFALEDLTRIQYTYAGETLTLDYADGVWTLAEDPDYHLDSSACNTMATALSALNAKRQLDAEAGEDYGLEDPLVSVTVSAAGQTTTILFGAENPVTGDVYLQKEGETAVYTAASSKRSCFEQTKEELFGAFNPAGLTSSSLEAVRYTLHDGTSVRIVAVSEPVEPDGDAEENTDTEPEYKTVWRLSDDTGAEVDATRVQTMISALSSYVSAQDTSADPSQYGFDAPTITVEAQTAEGTVTLWYSVAADGCYLMVSGDRSIYRVDSTLPGAFPASAEDWKPAE